MPVTVYEVIGTMAAVLAVWALESRNVHFQLSMLTLQILLIAGETALFAYEYQEPHFYLIAFTLFLQRAVFMPVFLDSDSAPDRHQ